MKQTHLLPDPEGFALAKACHAGNRQAQYALWGQFKNRMFGVCQRFTTSRQEAEDLLQESFVQVFRDIGRYRGEGSLEGWVRRIVLRTAIAHVQKQRTKTEMLNETELEQVLSVADQAFSNPDSDEPGRLVALLQKLPPGFRAVLNLYVIEERSHEEIARNWVLLSAHPNHNLTGPKHFCADS
ncbi:MAG: RNA polymerase sigma factor [Lewinellaceae bacterium]|nr:RNA polymerase sigma factor [Lewinellaceae bacterium]